MAETRKKGVIGNKRAAMLLYLATIALVIAAFTFLAIKAMEKPAKWEPKYVGEHQLAILKTATNANKFLLFVDQAVKPTAMQSVYGLAQKGGFPAGSECGQYLGYESWRIFSETDGEIKNCIPDESTTKYDISFAINNELYKYLKVYWGEPRAIVKEGSGQAGQAGGTTAAAPGTSYIDVKVGDSTIKIKQTTYAGNPQLKALIIHDDENMAADAANQVFKENNIGGSIYELEAGGSREISFSIGGKKCSIDPNRIFTPEGRKGKMVGCKGDKAAEDALIPLADKILGLFQGESYMVVLHNNDAGGFSINYYNDQYKAAAQEVNTGKDNPDDFFYVTKKEAYDDLKGKGYNVVLQKPGLKSGGYSESGNDGSISVAVDTSTNYINLEAQGKGSGHLDFQKKALLDSLKYLNPAVGATQQVASDATKTSGTPEAQKTTGGVVMEMDKLMGRITGNAAASSGSCSPIQTVSGLKTDDFMKAYGSSEEEVQGQLESVDFMGKGLSVHKKIAPALKCVVEDMKKCSEAVNYKINSIQSFNWRSIKGDEAMSLHSWGIAIDLNPSTNPMGPELVTDIPTCFVEAFKRYGFKWGGDFNGRKDAMHFEFRGKPDGYEVTIPAAEQITTSQGSATPYGYLGKIPPDNFEVSIEKNEKGMAIKGVAKEKAEFDIILGDVKKRKTGAGAAGTPTGQNAPTTVDMAGCQIDMPTTDSKSIGAAAHTGKLENAAEMPFDTPYTTMRAAARGRGTNYGTNELVIAMQKWGCALVKAYDVKLIFSDMSDKDGGAEGRHKSHTSGRDVDLGFVCKDGDKRTPCYGAITSDNGVQQRFDAEANWFLVKTMLKESGIRNIFLDARIEKAIIDWADSHEEDKNLVKSASAIITQEPGHDTHYHVRIKCPEGDSQCAA